MRREVRVYDVCVCAKERKREKWSVCVIDANGMYKKASEINWKLSGWVLRGEFLTRFFQSAFYSLLFKAFKKKKFPMGNKRGKYFF